MCSNLTSITIPKETKLTTDQFYKTAFRHCPDEIKFYRDLKITIKTLPGDSMDVEIPFEYNTIEEALTLTTLPQVDIGPRTTIHNLLAEELIEGIPKFNDLTVKNISFPQPLNSVGNGTAAITAVIKP